MHQHHAEPRRSIYYDYQVFDDWRPSLHPPEQRAPVVVAGAGPIGLVTALSLAQQGVRCVVLEAERRVSEGSGAIASGATLQVDTAEGPYTLQADWLVAADGARSAVRAQMDLKLEGASYEGWFVIADIRVDLPLPTERLAFSDPDWNPGNTILMHREPNGIWRPPAADLRRARGQHGVPGCAGSGLAAGAGGQGRGPGIPAQDLLQRARGRGARDHRRGW